MDTCIKGSRKETEGEEWDIWMRDLVVSTRKFVGGIEGTNQCKKH